MNAIFLTSRLEILIKYIIIALVQGVAEILPISSSGHMIIAQELLGIQTNDLSLEIFLHFGSLIAIFVFFRKKIWAIIRDFFLYLFSSFSYSSSISIYASTTFLYSNSLVIFSTVKSSPLITLR